ncbi:uncharacterized protein DS421_18g632260 [Arachis hypogaea]|nr:uncharacterized protein DS421_18g632260 [Arachis hypogaea]
MKPAAPSSSSRTTAARDAAAASESVAVKQSHGQREDPQVREREPGRAAASPATAPSHRRRLRLNHRQIRRCRIFWLRLCCRRSLPLLEVSRHRVLAVLSHQRRCCYSKIPLLFLRVCYLSPLEVTVGSVLAAASRCCSIVTVAGRSSRSGCHELKGKGVVIIGKRFGGEAVAATDCGPKRKGFLMRLVYEFRLFEWCMVVDKKSV